LGHLLIYIALFSNFYLVTTCGVFLPLRPSLLVLGTTGGKNKSTKNKNILKMLILMG